MATASQAAASAGGPTSHTRFQFAPATKEQSKARVALDGPSGSGKAQPLDAPILTPTGWRHMGDLKAGDRVTSSDGGSALVTGIYPQGEQPIYQVTFNDGAIVECTDDHLWLTQTYLDAAAKRPGTVKPLKEIAATLLDRNGKRNHRIPLVKPIEFDSDDTLPIDPYLLGVLLGDGHLNEHFVRLCNIEPELHALVTPLLPEGVELRQHSSQITDVSIRRTAQSGPNPLLDAVRQVGLAGTRSTDKFIPEKYLYGTSKTRIAVLQGLLDTDGYADGSTLEYSTSSQHLADQVRFLVESLGGLVTVTTRTPRYQHKGESRTGALSYRIHLRLPGWLAPFRLPRKRDAYRPRTKYQPTRFIDKVELVGRKPVQCISVDAADRLYVTAHCAVTHNTYTALTIAMALGSRIAVIDTERGSASKYANEFAFDVLELAYFSPDDLVEALAAAGSAGYEVVIVDSLSHFWSGSGGMLEQVDQAAKRGFGGNSFGGWKEARPMERRMIEALVAYPGHVIVTMRAKTDYVLETNDRGKQVPKKVGMKPEQREGLEYEFDIVGSMDWENTLVVTKSRAKPLTGAVVRQPGIEFGQQIRAWLEDGTAVEPVEDLITEANREDATFEDLGALMRKVRARRLEGAPLLTPDGQPTTLGERIQERGKQLRKAAQGGAGEGQAA